MNKKQLSEKIYTRYGNIKRARGCFLYTEKTVRLTDMYQEDGRAILGWEGGKARLAFKNILERGQTGSFGTCHQYQLEKAVLELFPWFNFVSIAHETQVKNLPLWRPWISDVFDEEAFYFVPPFPFACDYVIVCAKDEKILSSMNTCQFDVINPVLLGAFARAVYDLAAALQTRTEEQFRFYDKSLLKYFDRKGPFLFPKIGGPVTRENYDSFVEFCLDNQVVISPDFDNPSIIPFGADYGVLRKLSSSEFSV